MKGICYHCRQFKEIVEHNYNLCDTCKDLKQYQKKEKTKQKPIRKKTTKLSQVEREYSKERKVFLSLPENKVCFIEGCNRKADTVEHTRGRGHQGYFDDWAKQKGIVKTLDKRFWKPCCLQHNLELEQNPELAKKYKVLKNKKIG